MSRLSTPACKLMHLCVIAQTLSQIVEDVAEGIHNGVLRDDLTQARRVRTITSGMDRRALDIESLDAAAAFRDGRVAFLCDLLSTLSPRTPLSPAFLLNRALKIACGELTHYRWDAMNVLSFAIEPGEREPEEASRS